MGTPLRDSAARVVAIAALTLTACNGSPQRGDVARDKAGNPPAAVTLTLATSEGFGTPGYAIVERFVARVVEEGDGQITIDVTVYPPDFPNAWDQEAIRALVDGSFDMALVPARAWHTEGVETLEPLQVPFLIQTDAQADRVAADPVAGEMLAGLSAIEVTGLAIYPEGIRHIVGLDGADVAADGNLSGRTVRAPLSDTTWATLEALGADVVDMTNFEFEAAVASGEVTAAESSLLLMSGVPAAGQRSILANVTLYTKFQVLAITDAAYAKLDDATRDILRRAAEGALTETVAERPKEADALARACAEGAVTVFASAADVDAIRHAVAPVIDRLAADPAVGSLIEQVRAVAGASSATELAGCPDTGGRVAAPEVIDPADVRPVAGGIPNGTYRFAIDEETLLAVYPNFPVAQFGRYVGVWTLELRDGHYTLELAPDDPSMEVWDSNVYEVHDDVFTWVVNAPDDPYAWQHRWSLGADGSLTFEPPGGKDRTPTLGFTDNVLTLVPWEKID